jgi:hypothetical protein
MGVEIFSLCAAERTGLDAGVDGDGVDGVFGVDGVDGHDVEEGEEGESGLSHVIVPVPPKLGSLK